MFILMERAGKNSGARSCPRDKINGCELCKRGKRVSCANALRYFTVRKKRATRRNTYTYPWPVAAFYCMQRQRPGEELSAELARPGHSHNLVPHTYPYLCLLHFFLLLRFTGPQNSPSWSLRSFEIVSFCLFFPFFSAVQADMLSLVQRVNL